MLATKSESKLSGVSSLSWSVSASNGSLPKILSSLFVSPSPSLSLFGSSMSLSYSSITPSPSVSGFDFVKYGIFKNTLVTVSSSSIVESLSSVSALSSVS